MNGFTHSMKENPKHTIQRVFAVRTAITTNALAHHGRVVSFVGDSALVTFDQREDAYKFVCGTIQSSPERINYGVACGDVYVIGTDVFGYSVNMASRLGEDEAANGQILTDQGDKTNVLCN